MLGAYRSGRVVLLRQGAATSPARFAAACAAIVAADGLHAPLSDLSVDDELLQRVPSLRGEAGCMTFDAHTEPPGGAPDDAPDALHLVPGQTVVRAVVGVCDAAAHSEGALVQLAKEFLLDVARIHRAWGPPCSAEPVARLLVFGATEHHLEHAAFFGPHCRFIMHSLPAPAPSPCERSGGGGGGGTGRGALLPSPAALAPLLLHLRLELRQLHSLVLASYAAELTLFHQLEDGGAGAHAAQQQLHQLVAGRGGGVGPGDQPQLHAASAPPAAIGGAGASPLASLGASLNAAAFGLLLGSGGAPASTAQQQLQQLIGSLTSVRCGRLDVGLSHGLGGLGAALGALRRRLHGRLAKHRADVLLLLGAASEAADVAERAGRTLRAAGDSLFAALADETRAAALAALREWGGSGGGVSGGDADGDGGPGYDEEGVYSPAIASALSDAVAQFDALASSLQLLPSAPGGGGGGGGGASSLVAAPAAAPAADATAASAAGGAFYHHAGGGGSSFATASPAAASSGGHAAGASSSAASAAAATSSAAQRDQAVLCELAGQLVVSSRVRLAHYLLFMGAPPQRALGALCAVSGAPRNSDGGALLAWWTAHGAALGAAGRLSRETLRGGAAAAAHERSRADATLLALHAAAASSPQHAAVALFPAPGDRASARDSEAAAAAVAGAVFMAQRTGSSGGVRVEVNAADVARSSASALRAGGGGGLLPPSSPAGGEWPLRDGDNVDGRTSVGGVGAQSLGGLGELKHKLSETMRRADAQLQLSSTLKKASAAAQAAAQALPYMETLPAMVMDTLPAMVAGGGGGGGSGGGGRRSRWGASGHAPGPMAFAEPLAAAVAKAAGIRSPSLQAHALLLAADVYECAGLWRRADACVVRAARALRALQPPLASDAFYAVGSGPGPAADALAGGAPGSGGGCIYAAMAAALQPPPRPPVSASSAALLAAMPSPPPSTASILAPVPALLPWPLPWLHAFAGGSEAASLPHSSTSAQPFSGVPPTALVSVTGAVGGGTATTWRHALDAPPPPGGGWLRCKPGLTAALLTLTSSLRDPAQLAQLLPLLPGERIAGGRAGGSRDAGAGGGGPRVLLSSSGSGVGEWGPAVLSDLWTCGELPLVAALASLLAAQPASAWASEPLELRLPPSTSILRGSPAPPPPLAPAGGRGSGARAAPGEHHAASAAPPAAAPAAHRGSSAPAALRTRRALLSCAALSLYDASPLITLRSTLCGSVLRGHMSRLDALVALQLLGASVAEEHAALAHTGDEGALASSPHCPLQPNAGCCSDRGDESGDAQGQTPPPPAGELRGARFRDRPHGLLAAVGADLCSLPAAVHMLGSVDADLRAASLDGAAIGGSSASARASGETLLPSKQQQQQQPYESWRPSALVQALCAYMLPRPSVLVSPGAAAAQPATVVHHHSGSSSVALLQRVAHGPTNVPVTISRTLHVPLLPLPVLRLGSLSFCVVPAGGPPHLYPPGALAGGGGASGTASAAASPRVPQAAPSTDAPAPPYAFAAGSGGSASATTCICDFVAAPPASSSSAAPGGGHAVAAALTTTTTTLVELASSGPAVSRARMMMMVEPAPTATGGSGGGPVTAAVSAATGHPLAIRTYHHHHHHHHHAHTPPAVATRAVRAVPGGTVGGPGGGSPPLLCVRVGLLPGGVGGLLPTIGLFGLQLQLAWAIPAAASTAAAQGGGADAGRGGALHPAGFVHGPVTTTMTPLVPFRIASQARVGSASAAPASSAAAAVAAAGAPLPLPPPSAPPGSLTGGASTAAAAGSSQQHGQQHGQHGQLQLLLPVLARPPPPPLSSCGEPPGVARLLVRVTGALVVCDSLLSELPLALRPADPAAGTAVAVLNPRSRLWDLEFVDSSRHIHGGGDLELAVATSAAASTPTPLAAAAAAAPADGGVVGVAAAAAVAPAMSTAAGADEEMVAVYGSSWAMRPPPARRRY